MKTNEEQIRIISLPVKRRLEGDPKIKSNKNFTQFCHNFISSAQKLREASGGVKIHMNTSCIFSYYLLILI